MGATTRIVHGLTRSRRRCAGAIELCNLAPTSRRPFVPSEPTTRRCADSRPFSTSRPSQVMRTRRKQTFKSRGPDIDVPASSET
jgi:hypothetical protein